MATYSLDGGIVGVIFIPKIDVERPHYFGATSDNFTVGAAVLRQSGLHIGSKDMNCVIVAHRDWRGMDYFRHLDKRGVGDIVTSMKCFSPLRVDVRKRRISRLH